jgi:site-specific recombinase XerD
MMSRVRAPMSVLQGGATDRRWSPVEAAYEHFRLERQGNLVSVATLQNYDDMVLPFLAWAEEAGAHRFEDLNIAVLRAYRAELSTRIGRHGRQLQPHSILDSHKALLTFFRWARAEGYQFDPRILDLQRPKVPEKEPDVYHINQVKAILAACNPRVPQEDLIIRVLVGSGTRASELCGLALLGPDGLPDLMLDSLGSGRVELRVRWDGGAKGRKSRRVPITPKLATAIKRYEARLRPNVPYPALLINEHRRPFRRYGVDAMMDRLQVRVGFRVHAHAFRHTFATIATKLGWNFEHLRAAMGHSDYKVLQRYVRLATERDLGQRREWTELIVSNPALDWT